MEIAYKLDEKDDGETVLKKIRSDATIILTKQYNENIERVKEKFKDAVENESGIFAAIDDSVRILGIESPEDTKESLLGAVEESLSIDIRPMSEDISISIDLDHDVLYNATPSSWGESIVKMLEDGVEVEGAVFIGAPSVASRNPTGAGVMRQSPGTFKVPALGLLHTFFEKKKEDIVTWLIEEGEK